MCEALTKTHVNSRIIYLFMYIIQTIITTELFYKPGIRRILEMDELL